MKEAVSGRKIRILLVDDNPGDVFLFRQALGSADLDYELIVLEDGAEALAFARRQGEYADTEIPDLAVLDLNLPKNDGMEVFQALRGSPLFASVPVAILSSSSSPRERAKLAGFGEHRFITKPPDLDEFLRIGLVLKAMLAGN